MYDNIWFVSIYNHTHIFCIYIYNVATGFMSAVLRQIYEGEFMYDLFHGEGKMFGTQPLRLIHVARSTVETARHGYVETRLLKAPGESCCTIFEALVTGGNCGVWNWNPLDKDIYTYLYTVYHSIQLLWLLFFNLMVHHSKRFHQCAGESGRVTDLTTEHVQHTLSFPRSPEWSIRNYRCSTRLVPGFSASSTCSYDMLRFYMWQLPHTRAYSACMCESV